MNDHIAIRAEQLKKFLPTASPELWDIAQPYLTQTRATEEYYWLPRELAGEIMDAVLVAFPEVEIK